MSQRLIRLPEVMRRTGMSRSSIYAAIKNQQFPRPARIGKRSVAWAEERIDKLVNDLIEASDNPIDDNDLGI